MRPLKALGQNFLYQPSIAAEIVALAGIGLGDLVWEIGPGKGILTRELVAAGCRLTAFELDRRLELPLLEEFGQSVNIRMGDVLKMDWESELAAAGGPVRLVANIPYNITSPLLEKLEKHHSSFISSTMMVQKEVAQRICAGPGTKAYGVMTLRLKRLFDSEILLYVDRIHFDPVPEVDSAVLSLKPRKLPPDIPNPDKYLRLITLAFAHRRKTLRNNLASLMDRPSLEALSKTSGIDLGRRGETLSEEEFIALSRHI